jgi:hypothetical protein
MSSSREDEPALTLRASSRVLSIGAFKQHVEALKRESIDDV